MPLVLLTFVFLLPLSGCNVSSFVNKFLFISVEQAQAILDQLVKDQNPNIETVLNGIGFHVLEGNRVKRRFTINEHDRSFPGEWKQNHVFTEPNKSLVWGDKLDKDHFPAHYQVLNTRLLESFCKMYFPNKLVVMVYGDDLMKFYETIKDIPGVHPPVVTGVCTEWAPVVVNDLEVFYQICYRFDKFSDITIYCFKDNFLTSSWE